MESMRKIRDDNFFKHLIQCLDEQNQSQLLYEYAHKSMYDEMERQREREVLKKEIIKEVLDEISVMTETKQAIGKIKDLKNAIDNLSK